MKILVFIILFYVSTPAQPQLVDSLKSAEMDISSWQLKLGLSANNKNIYNLEGSYRFCLSKNILLSLDARIYSFLSFTPTLITRPLNIFYGISFAPSVGLGIIALGPVYGLEAFTVELGLMFRVSFYGNHFLIAYKQISSSAHYPNFYSLPPQKLIENFPIRFFSVGIEF